MHSRYCYKDNPALGGRLESRYVVTVPPSSKLQPAIKVLKLAAQQDRHP